ncbi:MAG: hypothetical protein IKW21_05770 [Lachnospiraceae bacterium]|nr:hypothetical protein [Lachnospiraceae bacterium]
MKPELVPCKFCHCKKAETYKVGDLWYVRCRGTKKGKDGETIHCKRWSPYEFLGFKEEGAIEAWNTRNTLTPGVKKNAD